MLSGDRWANAASTPAIPALNANIGGWKTHHWASCGGLFHVGVSARVTVPARGWIHFIVGTRRTATWEKLPPTAQLPQSRAVRSSERLAPTWLSPRESSDTWVGVKAQGFHWGHFCKSMRALTKNRNSIEASTALVRVAQKNVFSCMIRFASIWRLSLDGHATGFRPSKRAILCTRSCLVWLAELLPATQRPPGSSASAAAQDHFPLVPRTQYWATPVPWQF